MVRCGSEATGVEVHYPVQKHFQPLCDSRAGVSAGAANDGTCYPVSPGRGFDTSACEVREPDSKPYDVLDESPAKDESSSASNKEVLTLKLLRLADNLNDAVAAHCFYRDAVMALMAQSSETETRSLQGLRVTGLWLKHQDEGMIAVLDQIRAWVREIDESSL